MPSVSCDFFPRCIISRLTRHLSVTSLDYLRSPASSIHLAGMLFCYNWQLIKRKQLQGLFSREGSLREWGGDIPAVWSCSVCQNHLHLSCPLLKSISADGVSSFVDNLLFVGIKSVDNHITAFSMRFF